MVIAIKRKWIDFVNCLKFKISCLRLNESDYLMMEWQSDRYKKMISAINIEIKQDSEDITKDGELICRLNTGKKMVVNIDIKEMLKKIGMTFDENVIWNVK